MTKSGLSWVGRIALAAALLFALFPIFWLASTSFKPRHELSAGYHQGSEASSPESRSGSVTYGAVWVPSEPTLGNFRDVFFPYEDQMGMEQTSSWRALVSSTIIAAIATPISVAIGFLAAIAFARYRVGGQWMPLYVLSFRMIPPVAIAIPIAVLLSPLGIKNTPLLLPAIYAATTVPLSTWILKSFIDQVPKEFEEAAMLDGMSRWGAHFRVTLPLAKGGLAVTFLFVFVLNWTEGPIAMALAQGQYVTIPVQLINKAWSPHVQVALAVLAMVPPLAISLGIHRHLGRGFTFGAIKS
jgi:multiple sugar transport system permease protein